MTFWKEEGAGRQRQRHVDSSGGARGPTALSSPTTCPRVQPGPTRCGPGQPSTHVPREWARRTCEMTVPDEGSVLAASLLPTKRRPAAQSGRQQSGTPPVIRQQRGASNDSGNKHDTVHGPKSQNREQAEVRALGAHVTGGHRPSPVEKSKSGRESEQRDLEP